MNLVFSLIILLFFSSKIFSQAGNHDNRPKDIRDNPQYLKAMEMEKSRSNVNIQVSEYFGLESKITSLLLNDIIPASFPKSVGYTEKNKYIEVINSWLKGNQNLVKSDKTNNLITE